MSSRIQQELTDQAVRSAVRAIKEEVSGREDDAWRAGRPKEDPEKTKRWGFVTAKPSEYLVHMRRGKVRPRSSGQGATCFKWPWDSVAVIPTTIQRIYFQADQVTSEKVGVQVRGLSVYRVARPELAVTMLNFSYPERAQEKLAETLRDMFVGAVRRLVANLSVEECLTRRKEALAAFLMNEIAPVVGGSGRTADSTDKGWGVLIDTIEIQDVKVLSEVVFTNMQAPYRNQLELRAKEAELAREREIEQSHARAAAQLRELKARAEAEAAQAEAAEELKRLAARVEAERARVEAEREIERRRLEKEAALARAKAERERDEQAWRARAEAEARKLKAEADAEAAETEAQAAERQRLLQAQAEQAWLTREREAELEKLAFEAQVARGRAAQAREGAEAEDALAAERAARAQELSRQDAASKAEVRRLELELARLEGELKATLAARQREVENAISLEKLQSDFVNVALPQIAKVLQQNFGKVEVIAGAGENPFGFLVHAFEGVMDIARQGGLAGAVAGAAGALAQPPAAARPNGAGAPPGPGAAPVRKP